MEDRQTDPLRVTASWFLFPRLRLYAELTAVVVDELLQAAELRA